jgi:hypothetical protein
MSASSFPASPIVPCRRFTKLEAELSRYRAVNGRPRCRCRSGDGAVDGFPMSHRADAMNVSGQCGSFVTWGNEEISKR